MRYYPVALNIYGRKALVVGGGVVAERKALSLLRVGGLVKVVSPEITPGLKRLVKSKEIKWIPRKVRKADITKNTLIIAATDDSGINKKISSWAKAEGILINAVDSPFLSTFISPAVFRSNKAIIAVYTDGRNPVLSRDLKNYLKEHRSEFLSYRNRLS